MIHDDTSPCFFASPSRNKSPSPALVPAMPAVLALELELRRCSRPYLCGSGDWVSLTSLVYIIAVGKHAQSTAATPLRSFLKFSQSLRRPPTVAIWLKGQSTDWLNLPSPTWSEKVRQHLPLGGVLREGSRS